MATDKGLEDVPEGEFSFSAAFVGADAILALAPGRRATLSPLWGVVRPLLTVAARPPRSASGLLSQCAQTPGTDGASHPGQIESNYDGTVDSFDDMNLKAELLRGRQPLRPGKPALPHDRR